MMKLLTCMLPLLFTLPLLGQAPSQPTDPWKAIAFLQGTWEAKTAVPSDVKASGTYTFAEELKRRIVARHSTPAGCSGPTAFDCEHGDLLYIYQDAPAQPLKAIYFDNEGHVIHYVVSTPDTASVMFLSEPGPGPRFRLLYQLKNAVMSGKFQMQPPGQQEWRSYLEWSGGRK